MITSSSLYSLDFQIRPRDLARNLRSLGSVSWPQYSNSTRLFYYGDALWIADPRQGLTEVGPNHEPDRWTRRQFDFASIGPGWRSDAAAVTKDGVVLRIAANGELRRAVETGMNGENLAVIGLPQNLVLIKRYEQSGSWFELWSDRMLWRREGSGHEIVPHDGSLYRLADGALERIDWSTGKAAWSTSLTSRSIIGMSDELVWLRGDAQLAGIDLQSGSLRCDIRTVNNRAVEGVLDAEGLYHSLTGLRYQVYDLAQRGSLREEYVLGSATTAPGNLTHVATAERIVFPTDHAQFFAFDRHSPEGLTKIASLPPPIPPFGIAHGKFWMLTPGALRLFGES